jgi:molecular chaperone DnaJ
LPLNFAQVAIGDKVEVPTLNGKVEIAIPPGTQPDKIFRLRGKGITRLHGHGRGDQLIRVRVWTPTKLSVKEKKLFEELASSENMKPPRDRSFFSKIKEAIL